jgi:hypothetical protein
MPYDAFISYSHAADGNLAPAIQAGLERFTKSWWRRRALRVFRDETGLGVNPHLWRSIETALGESSWFVLLASPDAAGSPWVNKELEHWLASKSAERVLPVVTDGTIRWDDAAQDFSADSTAIPPGLRSRFREEPLYLDLRWARSEDELDLRHPRFKSALARLAAPLHGVTPASLEVKDVRRQRRVARVATAALAVLAVAAIATSVFAVNSAAGARRSEIRARSAQFNAIRQARIAQTSVVRAAQQSSLAKRAEQNLRTSQARLDATNRELLLANARLSAANPKG